MLFFARFPRPSPVVVGLRLGAMARVLAFLRYFYFEQHHKKQMAHVSFQLIKEKNVNVFPHIFISRKNTTGARVVNHGRKRVILRSRKN